MNLKPLFRSGIALLLGGSLASCTPKSGPEPPVSAASASIQTPALLPAAGPPLFEEIGEKAGLHYVWAVQGKRPLNILQTIGNGCAFLDFDGDGNLDILLVGEKVALYKGDGHGHFTDVSEQTGLTKLKGHFLGVAVGDFDGDGRPDLYLTAYRGGALLRNAGGTSFVDVTKAAGIAPQTWTTSAAFADLDGDGKLDLYLGNYVKFDAHTQPQLCDFSGTPSSCGPRYYTPEKPRVYRNLGGGKFEDKTKAWLPDNIEGKNLGVAIADFDGSGKQSLALANDEVKGDLLYWEGGRFVNLKDTSGTSVDNDGGVHGGMGTDWGDYDGDGKLDLGVATFQNEAKSMYHNEGGKYFTDRSAALGVAEKTMPFVAFGFKFTDFDNDGWLDLVIANGHVQDNIDVVDKSAKYKEPVQFLRNIEGKSFQDASGGLAPEVTKPIVGRGLAIGDYDNDGKLDALVVDSEGKPLLLHNVSPNKNHWLSVKLDGAGGNRMGIGALVTVEAGGRKLLRRCATDGSYLSASDSRVHFGLGGFASPVTVTVKWSGGKTDIFRNVAIDRGVTLKQGGH